MKPKYKILIITICGLIALSLITGATYAVWMRSFKQTDVNVVQTGCFSTAFTDGTSIKLANTYPMSDASGLGKEPYNFSIENTCSVYGEYYITLDIVDANTNIDLSKVKVALNGSDSLSPKILSTLTTRVLDSSDTGTYRVSYILAKGVLSASAKNDYSLRIWIDESADNSVANKKIEARLTITTSATKPKTFAETLDESATNNTLGANCVYDKTSDTEEYFIEGESTCNNYVWYSGKLWQVVSTDPVDGTVKLVTKNAVTSIGFNELSSTAFTDSYVDKWLQEVFEPTLYNKATLVANKDFNVTENNTDTKPATTSVVNKAVGLLNNYEYTMSYKNTTNSKGYLNIGQYWWLSNPYNSTTLRSVRSDSNVFYGTPNSAYGIRPTINLASSVVVRSGSGSVTDPYTINNDIATPTSGTLLNTRVSGEFVKFNDKLFRIVSIESGLIKINSYDYLTDTSNNKISKMFGSSATDIIYNPTASTSALAYYLNTDPAGYLLTLNTLSQNMIDPGIWYLGENNDTTNIDWHHALNTEATCNTSGVCSTTAMIGLPRVGEMWSNKYTPYTENSNIWLLNPYSANQSRVIYNSGSAGYKTANLSFAIRPSIYLQSDVFITGGLGTKESPFEISQ